MKTMLLIAALIGAMGWTDDFAAAKAKAAKEKKSVLLAFSGSDWCHWCVKLDSEVYSKPEFLGLATNKYVLAMADLPSDKSKLSAKTLEQNYALAKRFGVRGFPCAIVCKPDGTEIGRIEGYVKGGPEAYFREMEKVRNKAAK